MWCLLTTVTALATLGVSHGAALDKRRLRLFPAGRVVGGTPTDISQVPYQLQLEESGFQFCGASLIGSQYALTAAHCTNGKSSSGLEVRVGSSYHANGGYTVAVEAIYQHPQYDSQTTDFDVSVLRLSTPIALGPNVQPIQLASMDPFPGQYATVSGWGMQYEGISIQPFQLQSVSIPIRERQVCSAAYNSMFTSNMICAGGEGQDSCQGDSGGPLVVAGTLVGVVSWGYGCARLGYPGVYASVAHLRGFIDMYTGFQAKWAPPEKNS